MEKPATGGWSPCLAFYKESTASHWLEQEASCTLDWPLQGAGANWPGGLQAGASQGAVSNAPCLPHQPIEACGGDCGAQAACFYS